LLSRKPFKLDPAWWEERFRAAATLREGLFDPVITNGFRCVHGENDGLPGLVLDRYGKTLVLKLYTAAWFPHLKSISESIQNVFTPDRLILRLSRNIGTAGTRFGCKDGSVLVGESLPALVPFLENRLRFEADVIKGQKTGFFLDQRDNRAEVGKWASRASVLNLFSFSGGFSVSAARGGATEVTDLDVSAHALASARRQFENNREAFSSCQYHSIQADAFEWLAAQKRAGKKYDLVILDPPAMAKRQADVPQALSGYRKLVEGAARLVNPKGLLVACSCSAQVPSRKFFAAVEDELNAQHRLAREILKTFEPPDHPATFAEAHYLKAVYYRFGG
jgi:23S rRNA (cytosine1962-C5)-methyltransferase